mgnify:CR=1 FL=1
MHPFSQYFKDVNRRSFLKQSLSSLGVFALGDLMASDKIRNGNGAARFQGLHYPAKVKRVIHLCMAGGPSQLETFDYKPALVENDGKDMPESFTKGEQIAQLQGAELKVKGPTFPFSRHGKNGMMISDRFPHIAALADEIAVIRSMYTEQINHDPAHTFMNTGSIIPGRPSMGAWTNYGLGSLSDDLPGYVVLSSGVGSSGGATLWQSGFLPSTHAGVLFREQGEPVLNLANPDGLPPELQRASLDTLRDANQQRLELMRDPEIASRIASYELAYRMQSSAPELIDFSSESKATLEAYGVERDDPPNGGRGKSGNTAQSFGRNCLLARRMVERGVRFVNVIYASWDHHGNIDKELPYNAAVVDQPIAALIKDLKERGMLEDTMVVWGSEFGRTPLGQGDGSKSSGRDHHPFAFTMLMAGGGIKGGQVYGESDEFGWGVEDKPVHINDLHATMLHCFGLEHEQLTYRFQGRDFRLTDVGGEVIKDWLA